MLVELGGGRTVELDVEKDLALSDESLDDDMRSLGSLIGEYAGYMGETHAYAANKKYSMEIEEANADHHIRAVAKAAGDKVTEPAIKQQVLLNPQVHDARRAYYAAEAQFKTIEGSYRALRDVANLAIALCYKQKEEIRVMHSPIN